MAVYSQTRTKNNNRYADGREELNYRPRVHQRPNPVDVTSPALPPVHVSDYRSLSILPSRYFRRVKLCGSMTPLFVQSMGHSK